MGSTRDVLHPRAIVEHVTATSTFSSAYNTFAADVGRGPAARAAPERLLIDQAASAIARSRRVVRSRAAATVGWALATSISSPTTIVTRVRSGRGRVPVIRTGTSGAPVTSASRAAPRCQRRGRCGFDVPCGKIPSTSPRASSSAARPTRGAVAAAALDRERAERSA